MSKDGTNRLEAFLRTPEGERFLAQSEADAARKEAAVQQRRDIAAERDEYLRRRKEVLPVMRRTVEAAERDLAVARAAYRAAQDQASDARRAESGEDYAIHEGLRRVEIALTTTADSRVIAAIEDMDEALRTWHHTSAKLHRFESRKAVNWDGTEEFVKFFGDNEAGVDAMRQRIEAAEKALRALALLPEPEDAAVEAAVSEARAAIEAIDGIPPSVMVREFDHEGRPVGR